VLAGKVGFGNCPGYYGKQGANVRHSHRVLNGGIMVFLKVDCDD